MSPRVSDEYKVQRRKQLIQTAKRVFIMKGYSRATMLDIMNEAKVSRGALYDYFANIEDAFLEVLQAEDQLDAAFFSEKTDSAWQQMKRFLVKKQQEIEMTEQSLFQANTEFFLYIRDQLHENHPGYRYIQSRYENLIEAITELIQRGTEQEEFKPTVAAGLVSRFFVTFLDGLMIDSAQLGAASVQMEDQIELFKRSLQQILRPSNRE